MKKIPEEGKDDIVHKLVKGAISGVPFGGGLAAEFFELIIKPPYTKRIKEWMESVYEDLKKLKEKDESFNIEDLANNEMFTTTVLHATQVAIRNHQKEKLEALRAAVLNSTSPNAPEEDLQLMFLNWVDEFTPRHISTLKSFDFGTRSLIDIEDPKGLDYQVIKDLENRGLISFFKWPDIKIEDNDKILEFDEDELSKIRGQAAETTKLGSDFLKFITSPIEED